MSEHNQTKKRRIDDTVDREELYKLPPGRSLVVIRSYIFFWVNLIWYETFF